MTSPRPTSVRWRMLGLLMVASAVGYGLRINLSIAVPAMKADLGLTEVQLGLVLSAFTTLYALGQIPGGLLGEAIGPRRAMTWLMVGWGGATIAMGFVPGRSTAPLWLILGILILLRGLLGAFQAPLFPVTVGGTIARWFPPSRWAIANAAENVGFTLGSAAGGPIWVWLIAWLGWRNGFAAAGPVALIVAAVWWWYNRDDPREHRGVNQAELDLIGAGPEHVHPGPRAGWSAVLKDRNVLLLTVSYFCINYLFYLFFNWFFYYLTDVRGVSAELAGTFVGIQWIVGAGAAAFGGAICDWLGARVGVARACRLTAMGGILFATPCLLLGVAAKSQVAVVALLSISFASTQLVDPAFWVATMKVAGPRAPLATGVLNTGGNLAGSLAAILVPLVAESFGWAAGVGSGVIFAIGGALIWLWLELDRPVATSQGVGPAVGSRRPGGLGPSAIP